MFHQAHHMKLVPIADAIHFRFLAAIQEMINQDFIIWQMFQ